MGDETTVEEGSGSGLVIHAVVFVTVNLLLVAVWGLFTVGASFSAVPDLVAHPSRAKDAGFFPIYVLIFWGAGVVIHTGVYVAGIPRRRRLRRARRRQRRRLQRNVVSALGDGVLADAAIAGIGLIDGDKAAKAVKREAGRKRAKMAGASKAKKSTKAAGVGKAGKDPKVSPDGDAAASDDPKVNRARFTRRSSDRTTTRQWVAVMFTDIVDSTPLNQRLGDDEWALLLNAHRSTVRECLKQHRGAEVGTQGDGFLVRFESPDDAAACAISLQRELDRARDAEGQAVHIRIGIHAGEVLQNDDDLVGRVINLASRVTDAAASDEILVTEPFADHLSSGHPVVDRGLKTLKGFDQPRHLLALAWRSADEIVL